MQKTILLKIYENIEDFCNCCKRGIISVGSFDGLHQGHDALLNLMRSKAEEINGETIIFTFHPHPRLVLNHVKDFKLLSTKKEKIELFREKGINHLIIIEFTKDFARIPFTKFVENILVKQLDLKNLVLGYDHQFGKNREGNIENLTQLAHKYQFEIHQLEVQQIDNQIISSNSIRKLLNNGNILLANMFLGKYYSLFGKVVTGNRIGKKIGFPTANLEVENPYKLVPAIGVYATLTKIDGKIYNSMTNIGNRPTLEMEEVTIETNIFDFKEEIYGKDMQIFFIDKLRDIQKFDSIDALSEQLYEDKQKSLETLQNLQ